MERTIEVDLGHGRVRVEKWDGSRCVGFHERNRGDLRTAPIQHLGPSSPPPVPPPPPPPLAARAPSPIVLDAMGNEVSGAHCSLIDAAAAVRKHQSRLEMFQSFQRASAGGDAFAELVDRAGDR